jgi:hypothetical protein
VAVGGHRGGEIGPVGLCDRGDDLAGGRVHDVAPLLGLRVPPLSADEQPARFDVRSLHAHRPLAFPVRRAAVTVLTPVAPLRPAGFRMMGQR